MIDLADPATDEYLCGGRSLLICTVDSEGRPHASRLFGLTIVEAASGLIRVLVPADDVVALANIRACRPIAVTATNVTNLHSLQCKGLGVSVEVLTTSDEATQAVYTDAFLREVHVSTGYPMDVLLRSAGRTMMPCLITVDSSFDQTPGPSAGLATDRGTP